MLDSNLIMGDMPFFSVITVVLNDAKHIAETIESVLNQEYKDYEYIIVDGGSKDGTLEIISTFHEQNIVLISEKDNGLYDAMNKGIDVSKGRYFSILNSGDVFVNSKVLGLIKSEICTNQQDIIFFSWYRKCYTTNKLINPNLEKGLFNHQAIIYSRDIHQHYGKYININKFTAADYFFFASILRVSELKINSNLLPIVMIDPNGISSGTRNFSQKVVIDYLQGVISKKRLLFYLVAHPVYFRVKKNLNMIIFRHKNRIIHGNHGN